MERVPETINIHVMNEFDHVPVIKTMFETIRSAYITSPPKGKDVEEEPENTKEPINSISEPDNGHKTESIDLRIEADRLKTFKNWKNGAVSAESLAKAGFYFLNRSDLVKCAFCKAEVCRWESGDCPMEEHKKWSPNCPFLKSENRTTNQLFLPPGQDVCGNGEFFPNSVPENETFKLLKKMIRTYEDFKSRLETFTDWPKSLKQKPTELAEAGFYYKGVGDQTVCFDCHGALKDWEENDNPWEQHALWFPKCNFLISTKGQEYIDEVQKRLKSETSYVPCAKENGEKKQGDSEDKLCKICYSNGIEVVFIPCGHLMACVNCSLSLKNVCPICRKRFEATMRVFPS